MWWRANYKSMNLDQLRSEVERLMKGPARDRDERLAYIAIEMKIRGNR